MKIAFPLMGNYDVPIKYLFRRICGNEIIDSPKITSKTIEIGSKYSPDFVCTPFKYTLGTFIECLEMNADILIQMGGGCRYGYYFELQEKILKDLGYSFKYYNLVSRGHTEIKKIYEIMKEINPKLKVFKSIYYFLVTKRMVKYMDKVDDFIRLNSCYQYKDEYSNIRKNFLEDIKNTKGFINLNRTYKKCIKELRSVKVNKNKSVIKIGMIGELYTLMESFANYDLEEILIKNNVSIKRFTNVTYLLFEKGRKVKKYLKKLKDVKYRMGADALDNIYHTHYLINNNYDGIIHIKSSFCTPEKVICNKKLAINKICEENNMPVIFLSMDTNTSKVGFETRIEAFLDMIEMRIENE